MIAKLTCSPDAARTLCQMAGLAGEAGLTAAEIEFRELPYFLVSRSREHWTEGRGDINAVRVLHVTEHALIVEPGGENEHPVRHTIIPWTNVVSLTVERGD